MSHKRGWKEKWMRVARMDGRELVSRARQELNKRLDLVNARLGRPVSARTHGRQVLRARFFFDPEDVPGLVALLRERLPEQAEAIMHRAHRICEHRFDLLGYRDLAYGREIDWSLDLAHGKRAPLKPWYKVRYLDFVEVGDAKITWELNRHQHLVTLAKAFLLSGEQRFADEIRAQWYDWQKKNPYPLGINWASSLEVGFRSLAWLWVRSLLGDGNAIAPTFNRDLLRALALSGSHIEKYLSKYFSPNTHLLGEGVALFFIGTLCPELRAARLWQEKGWKVVEQECERQVQADGMHFEQSTYYHVYALDFFLHACLLAARNEIQPSSAMRDRVEKMLEALCFLSQTGLPPRYGDDDGGRVFDGQRNTDSDLLDPLATGAVLFDRGDFKAASSGLQEEMIWLLGQEGVARFDRISRLPPNRGSGALKDAGWYAMGSAEPGAARLFIDAGPQGAATAGHGHADALSIQLITDNKMLLLDPGTFEYVGSTPERDRFRGTSAHNTLEVDRLPQAEPRGPFAWKRLTQCRVESWLTGDSFDRFVGSHDGYQRLASPVTHHRHVFHLKSQFWLVRDVAEGTGVHHLNVRWHLGNGLVPRRDVEGYFDGGDGGPGLAIVTAEGQGWERSLEKAFWSPVYGRKQGGAVLRCEVESQLPCEHVTLLVPVWKAHAEIGCLRRIASAGNEVAAYTYEAGERQHAFIFAREGKPWVVGNWACDAEFLYCCSDSSAISHIVLCNGSYVDFQGQRVLTATTRVSSCELICSPLTTQLLSAERELITISPGLANVGHAELVLRGPSDSPKEGA